MKKYLIIPMFMAVFGTFAQSTPKQAIEAFFEAMHKRDTLKMRDLTYGNVRLQSIGKDKAGKNGVHSEDFGGFLKMVKSIPENMEIEERIHAYETKTDGAMAHVWTPYSFYLNGKLSHCGANSFQLFKKGGNWKIISILDTRRRENCGE